MNKRTILVALFVFSATLACLTVPIRAHAQNKQLKLLEAADKEGVFDIIATWRPQEANAIFASFKETYPFVEVRQTMMSGAVGFERLRAEFASGRRTTDLINTSLIELKKAGMLQAWEDWYE